ncbi:uncharacterized protein LOC123298764 [Chrysoperla carnea]|uniref:uncharacterized protein LOC123298764 n=1 Tax=Chrysoperla carnea TaxID=189513 RepID=UPI001D086BF4|nr:uncharacterized protein LOC123298764 [Chrysoperla carnea]
MIKVGQHSLFILAAINELNRNQFAILREKISRLYSLLEVLKKLTEEQSHFIDLDLRNDLSNIHWDLVNLEYTMAQIIPAIENSLLNHSRKDVKDTPKDDINDTALQEIPKKENEKDNEETADKDNDKSTKVLKDLEERWRTIRSNLNLNIDIIKKNSKQSVVPSSCGDDSKRTSIYNNMLSIKDEVNRKLSTHKETRDDYKIIDNKSSLPSRPSSPPVSISPPISIFDEQIENTMLLDSKNLTKSIKLMINENITKIADNKTITVLQDKTQTFYDSESLFSIDMQSSSSLEKNVLENCKQHFPIN